jgi:hypothetical protein
MGVTVKRNKDGTKTITDNSTGKVTTKKGEGSGINSGYIPPKSNPVIPAPSPFGPPSSAFGTSSAQYGQVSPAGQIEIPALGSTTNSVSNNLPAPNPFATIPQSAYGTSSAQYGQVSPTGQVEVPPLTAQSQPTTAASGGVNNSTPQPGTGQTSVNGSAGGVPLQTRTVQVQNPDGSSTAYTINNNDSYFNQLGKYEFDFWSSEGQKERLLAALDMTSPFNTKSVEFGGNYVPGASEATRALILAANIGSVLTAGAAVFKALSAMNKVGAVAMSARGAEQLASTIPEASGSLPWLAKAGITGTGEAALNTKTAATSINFIKSIEFGAKLTTVGGILTILGMTGSGVLSTKEDKVKFSKDSGDLAVKLREVGMNSLADELYATNKDLVEGFDQLKPFLPLFGKSWAGTQIQDARDELNDANRAYESAVKAENEAKIAASTAADVTAAEVKAAADKAALADKRAYDEKQAAQDRQNKLADVADQRNYDAQQQQDQRNYDAQQQATQQQSQSYADAAALESSGGSTLTFGLLNTGGGTQFVDKDKAAQVYFGKVYDQLTPEQQMLLNLLKGGD